MADRPLDRRAFERPAEYGGRRLLTEAELAAVQQRVTARNRRYDDDTSNNRIGGGHWAETRTEQNR